jgi:hypothetical protein
MVTKNHFHNDRQNLTRIWTERLYREYENVLFHFGVRLVTPQIVITDNISALGLWNSETRTISIARKLVEDHSWDIVIEVLKHEMAHQIVSELFAYNELHGALFKKACGMLAVADWAASATGRLPDVVPSWREKSLSDEDERLLKRAEKLLALAESANEHEASLAMKRVRELYEKYNFENIRAARSPDLVWTVLCRKKRKTDTVDSMILSILNRHFFVRVIHTNLYDAADNVDYKAAEVLGSRQNVLMAEYVYHFLRQKTESLTDEYRRRAGVSAMQGRSYAIGLLTGFMQKLNAEAGEQHTSEEKSLVKSCDRQLADYLRSRHPKIANRRFGATYRDSGSYESGRQDGRRISISRGVTHSAGNQGKLLR